MTLVFVAEQVVGIDGISARIDPAEGHSTGDWHPHFSLGDLGPSQITVQYGDVALSTNGESFVAYTLDYSSPLLGRFHLTDYSAVHIFSGQDWGDGLWRIGYDFDGGRCREYPESDGACYAIGRWVEEAATAQAAVPTPEPGFLFVAMVAVVVGRYVYRTGAASAGPFRGGK